MFKPTHYYFNGETIEWFNLPVEVAARMRINGHALRAVPVASQAYTVLDNGQVMFSEQPLREGSSQLSDLNLTGWLPMPYTDPAVVEASPRPEYQARVVQERTELNERIEKLTSFLYAGPEGLVHSLPVTDVALMRHQLQTMQQYSNILSQRINRWDTLSGE